MLIAHQFATALAAQGILRVYGLPGEDHMALLDAFEEAGIEYCASFNESSAVIMAATEAHLTGRPGVVMLSLSAGISNGYNGLMNSHLEQAPVILVSGQHRSDELPFVVRQGFDLEQMVAPCTKWRARATVAMDIPGLVAKAIEQALTGTPGPVYIELPDNVATTDADVDEARLREVSRLVDSRFGAAHSTMDPTPDTVQAIRDRLAAAQRPVLVIGGRRTRVSPDVVATFAEAFRVPVMTSSRQKGLLDSTNDYYAGTFLNGRLERDLLDRSDLVLMVDPEAFDFYNKPWCFDADAVALIDNRFTDWSHPYVDRFVVCANRTLARLVETASQSSTKSEWTADDVKAYRVGLRSALLDVGNGFSVSHAVDGALSAWPTDGYLVADAGFTKPIVAMLSEPAAPNHYFASHALSTMGYAIPAALAIKHSGHSPVLAFMGDGSFLMRATETMVNFGGNGPLVYVVVIDRSLGQIEVKQRRRKLARVGISLPEVSCERFATAFGIRGVDVRSRSEMVAAVKDGMNSNTPTLIGAHIDPGPTRELYELLRG
nr:thiamine pyrophosphate-binding protein [Rhodococcus sp. 06-621-2]